MAYQFVLGTTGTGKTTYVFDRIEERMAQTDMMELYIVPEQYTLQAQEEYLEKSGKRGLIQMEVISFNRLIYRFYDHLALINHQSISDNGKSLLIRRIIENHLEEFVWIKRHRKRQSFMDELATIISECYQYTLDEDRLKEFAEKVDDQLLKDKLKDLSRLLAYYKDAMKETYISGHDAFMRLIETIPTIDDLNGANITIDAFYGFTPIQYQMIEALMSTAGSMTFSLSIDAKSQLGDMKNESDLFFETKKIVSEIRKIGDRLKIEEKDPVLLDQILQPQKEDLKHLTNHLFKYPIKTYKDEVKGLRMVEARSIEEEVEVVCERIDHLISSGKRYKDIVVLVSEMAGYESVINEGFRDYGFSFFMDKKDTISHHPLIQFVLSALLTVQYNFKYEHIFYHLKTMYYTRQDDICKLENYCFERGLKGQKAWTSPWDIYDTDKNDILFDFFKFAAEIKEKKMISEKIEVLYDYLEALDVFGTNEKMTAHLESIDQVQEAVLYGKIYGSLMDFLDDTYHMIGDETVSMKEFVSLMETGLSSMKFSQTPPSLDQIIVGDLSRTRFKASDYIFVLGINEGKVPLIVNNNQLLTDSERATLMDIGLEVAPTQKKSLFKEQMNIFNGFTKSRQLLHLSFTRSSDEGTMRPASIFFTLMKMFPACRVENSHKILESTTRLSKNRPVFYRLTKYLNGHDFQTREKEIQDYFKYFNDRFEKGLMYPDPKVFFGGLTYDNKVSDIDQMSVSEYNLSVSELESFAGCSYAHYLDYRLKLGERQEYVVTLPDIGILFHKCLELYIKKCVQRDLDISHMELEVRNGLVDECIGEILNQDKYKIFTSSYRNRYLVVKLTRIVKRALWGIENQLQKSLLQPKDIEYNFDGKKSDLETLVLKITPNMNMFLKGVVDRVDEYETEDDLYISIIDYKSSHKTLDFGLIDSGIQLQLFVYLNVVKEIKEHNTSKKVTPTGLYYYQIQDPFVKNETYSEEEIESKLLGQLKPSGLVLHDEHIIKMMDQDISGSSQVIPVTLTSKGISSRSSTITEEDMKTTLDFVNKKARWLGEKIYKGDVTIKPYDYDGRTACDFCSYKAICRFDPSNKSESFNNIKKSSKDDIISHWEGDSSGRSHQTNH